MTLSEFAKQEPIGRLIYPSGLPATLRLPDWPIDGNTEMDGCQRDVFVKLAGNAPAIRLSEVVERYPCLGFMDVEEAYDWTPLWMCASVYAYRTEIEYAGEVAFTAGWKLAKQMRDGCFPVSREAVSEFYKEMRGALDSSLEEAMVDVLGFDVEKETLGWWNDQ